MAVKKNVFLSLIALVLVLAAGAAILVLSIACAAEKAPEGKAAAVEPFVLDYVISGGMAGGEHRHLVAATLASSKAAPQAKETWIVTDAGAKEITKLLQEAGVFEWKSQPKGKWEDLFQHDLSVQAGGRKLSVTIYQLPESETNPSFTKLQKLITDIEAVLKAQGKPPKGRWAAVTENGDKPGTAIVLDEEGGKVAAGKFYILDPNHPGDLSKGIGYDLKDLVQEGKTIKCKVTLVDASSRTGTKDMAFTITFKADFKGNAVDAEVQEGGAAKESISFERK